MSESGIRRALDRRGYLLRKSRAMISIDNHGHYRIVETDRNLVVQGERFDMTLKDCEKFLDSLD